MTYIITQQTLPSFLVRLGEMLVRDDQVEVDIISKPVQIYIEDTQEYQDDCNFIDQYRKANPGRSDEVRTSMQTPENQVLLQSIYEKYGYKGDSVLRHK